MMITNTLKYIRIWMAFSYILIAIEFCSGGNDDDDRVRINNRIHSLKNKRDSSSSLIIERYPESLMFKTMLKKPNIDEYLQLRKDLYEKEAANSFENDIHLNERELRVNELIMTAKFKEIDDGFKNPQNFTPSRHFFEVVDKIEQSELYQMIKLMPKGGILHAHDMAMCSTNYVISLTYRENLWQCNRTTTATTTANGTTADNSNTEIMGFKFSKLMPTLEIENCTWQRVSDIRLRYGNDVYDNKIHSLFTLYTNVPMKSYTDINTVWKKFMNIFLLFQPIVTYAPVWKDYYKNALKEMFDDGVQYLEFRGILPPIYDLDGKIYEPHEIIKLHTDALDEFMHENPQFIGSKFIYAPLRNVENRKIDEYIAVVMDLNRRFPNFIAGFDLVGQEDLGRPLIDFASELLTLPDDIKFFLHAGETNWFGTSTDENLIDAILLGTHRIGHGFALAKHPTLIDLIKERDIAIEVNPISNQVLKLVDDLRNHPASYFFAHNVPLVISSDDPSFWKASPLSHDFYLAFLGIASKRSDLRTLKKLAMNSIKYSTLNDQEKLIAFYKWQMKWDEFIDLMIESRSTNKNNNTNNNKNNNTKL